MTVQASAGPLVTKGIEAALGSATATTGSTGAAAGYISGSNNQDAGPNCIFAGNLFKDMRARYREGGGALQDGGYPNQAFGFVDHSLLTVDFVPSTITTANIAALQAPTSAVALTLVAVSGAGITVEAAAQTIIAMGRTIPTGALRIDAAPAWNPYGTSGAINGWTGGATGRAVSLTSAANLSAITFTIKGYSVWGSAMTQTIAGPNANTVNTTKAFKWISSVPPSATSGSTVSIGTADIFGLPILARRFSQLDIWYNETGITANTGFVTADVTSPATGTTGDTRGTYAVQSASDGVKRLVVTQRILPADIATLTSVFGVPQFA